MNYHNIKRAKAVIQAERNQARRQIEGIIQELIDDGIIRHPNKSPNQPYTIEDGGAVMPVIALIPNDDDERPDIARLDEQTAQITSIIQRARLRLVIISVRYETIEAQ